MLNFMLSFVEDSNVFRFISNLKTISKSLLKKTNLPLVKQKEDLIRTVSTDDFWQQSVSVVTLENIRVEVRNLIRLLEKEKRCIVYSNFEDELTTPVVSDILVPNKLSLNYQQRVERYVRENESNPIIQKLKRNIPINSLELQSLENMLFDGKERGTKDDFIKVHGQQPLGKFIRSITGLDVNAAKEAFSDFLNAGNLSADQISFINMIIDYLTMNGIIEADMLFEEPFTKFHIQGIAGLFDTTHTIKIIEILNHINANAAA